MIVKNKITTIILSSILASCQAENNAQQYLDCYALEPTAKQICVSKLTKKYIAKNLQQDVAYVQEFQYKHEKSGFKQFLNKRKLPCNKINQGVLYNDEKQAYEIKCEPAQEYFMRFDSEKKKWSVLSI